MKNIDEIINKIFKEVEPEAVDYVTTTRKLSLIQTTVTMFIIALLFFGCLYWGLGTMLQEVGEYSMPGIWQMSLCVISGILLIILFINGAILLDDIFTLIRHKEKPKADAMNYWISRIRN